MSFHILGDQGWPETPTTGMCCMGSAMGGAGRCTCWEPVYDLEQAEPQLDAPTVTRSSMCDDCAYRPGSPERAGQEDAGADEEGLDALVYSGSPFTCHQGIRRPIRWLHPIRRRDPGQPARLQATDPRRATVPGEWPTGRGLRRLGAAAYEIRAPRAGAAVVSQLDEIRKWHARLLPVPDDDAFAEEGVLPVFQRTYDHYTFLLAEVERLTRERDIARAAYVSLARRPS